MEVLWNVSPLTEGVSVAQLPNISFNSQKHGTNLQGSLKKVYLLKCVLIYFKYTVYSFHATLYYYPTTFK